MDFKNFYERIIFDVDSTLFKTPNAKQGDTRSRGFYVTVMQNNIKVPVVNESMTFYCEKPDGTRVYTHAVVDGDEFRVDLPNQVFAVPGILNCELTLMGPHGEKITSRTFKMLVHKSLAENSIVSKDERGILDRAFELAEDILPRIELLDVDMLENYQDVVEQNKVKISSVEKQLNDLQSTLSQVNINQEARQEVSGYRVVSLPPNTANGQVEVGMQGLTVTNLIGKDGDFEDSNALQAGWGKSGSNHIYNESKGLGLFGSQSQRFTFRYTAVYLNSDVKLQKGHKYYASMYGKSITESGEGFGIMISPSSLIFLGDLINTNKWTRSSVIRVAEEDSEVRIYNKDIADREVEIDGIILVDLTAMGLEHLTKEECDKIFANYFDGTQSTLAAMRLKSVGKNLFDKEKRVTHNQYYLPDGSTAPVTGAMITNHYTPIKPNTAYRVSHRAHTSARSHVFYDKNLNIISSFMYNEDRFTTPNDAHYIRFTLQDDWIDVFQLEESDTPTPYEPYTESTQYITAKKDNKIVNLRSLPNGVRDEIVDGKLIKGVSDWVALDGSAGWEGFTAYSNTYRMEIYNWVIENNAYQDNRNFPSIVLNDDVPYETLNYNPGIDDIRGIGTNSGTGKRLLIRVEKEKIDAMPSGGTLAGFKEYLNKYPITLIYQLAEPEIIPVEVSGNLLSNPSGTVYIDHATYAVGIYSSNGITVTEPELPIKALNKITKIDYATGVEHEIGVSEAVISEDKLLFTHADLTDGDIVFFDYDYDVESTNGEVTIEYYDSRYVIQDSVTDKFYKWDITVADGVPSINLVEV